jgi:hypothetical protein
MSGATPILSTAPTSLGNCVYDSHNSLGASPIVTGQPVPLIQQTAAIASTTLSSCCFHVDDRRASGMLFSTEEVRVPLGPHGEDVSISVPRYAAEISSKRSGIARAPPGLENVVKPQLNTKIVVRPPGVHLPLCPQSAVERPPGLSGYSRNLPNISKQCLDVLAASANTPLDNMILSTFTKESEMQCRLDKTDLQPAVPPLPSLLNSVPRYTQAADRKLKMKKPIEVCQDQRFQELDLDCRPRKGVMPRRSFKA